MKLIFSGVFLALISPFMSTAQPSWEIGGFGGSTGYMGDLNPNKPYILTDPAFGGFVKRNFDGYWSFKFAVMSGKIRASDSKSTSAQFRNRNLNFSSPLTELSFQTEFNFFNYIPSSGVKRFSPYLFAGLGYVNFIPRTVYQGAVYDLSLYATEGQNLSNPYKTTVLTIPFGAGVKYNITGNITLGGEIGYRSAYTDYLDDVSGKYPANVNGLRLELADRSTPKNVPNSQRGDFRKHDTYLFTGLTLSYSIFSQKCPVVE